MAENIWVTRDGRRLRVSGMETEHLQNCVAMMRRKGFCSVSEFDGAWRSMGCLQGEYAQMAAENEIAGMRPHRALDVLEAELAFRQRRKN